VDQHLGVDQAWDFVVLVPWCSSPPSCRVVVSTVVLPRPPIAHASLPLTTIPSHTLTHTHTHTPRLPPQDRRKELSKKVSKAGEEAKVAVRNVRKDALKKLDK
jgi:hypothetical protein